MIPHKGVFKTAYVFLVSVSRRRMTARVLWETSLNDAIKLCSDPRANIGERQSGPYAPKFLSFALSSHIPRGHILFENIDSEHLKKLIKELKITIINSYLTV